MASKVDPNDFLINTDFEMDKIVWVSEGIIAIDSSSTTTPSGSKLTEKYIKHNLPFYPLVFGFCSYHKDFKETVSLPFKANPHMESTQGQTSLYYDTEVNLQTYGDTVLIYYESRIQNPQPIYYRIYGFEPTTSNAKVGGTKNNAATFLLDSDNNYRKLYKKGIIRRGDNNLIRHDLGYIPQCRFWFDFGGDNPGIIWDYYAVNGRNGCTITKDHISITFPTASYLQEGTLHYRIYYDKA